jgi:hypothetical protein
VRVSSGARHAGGRRSRRRVPRVAARPEELSPAPTPGAQKMIGRGRSSVDGQARRQILGSGQSPCLAHASRGVAGSAAALPVHLAIVRSKPSALRRRSDGKPRLSLASLTRSAIDGPTGSRSPASLATHVIQQLAQALSHSAAGPSEACWTSASEMSLSRTTAGDTGEPRAWARDSGGGTQLATSAQRGTRGFSEPERRRRGRSTRRCARARR